jgi:membrane dipeptidase
MLALASALSLLLAAPQQSAEPLVNDVEVRARAIHGRVLTLDTHKDISPLLAREAPSDPETRERFRMAYDPSVDGDQQVDFPKMRRGGLDCAFFIVYVGQRSNDAAGFARARSEAFAKFDAIDRMCARFPDDIGLARTPADVRRLDAEGKLIAAIGIENGYAMGEDLSLVEEFWRRGARYMSITHNKHSQLGDSNTPDEPIYGGLSELGRKAIAEMNRVGIMVDVSHAAKTTMMQAIEASTAPVIASHSGCRALCDHTRNLDDEQLRALAEDGGVIQIVAFDSYIKDPAPREAALEALRDELGLPAEREWPRLLAAEDGTAEDAAAKIESYRTRVAALHTSLGPASVRDLVDHVDHAVQICGIDHVALSSDFDGGGGIEGWRNAGETFEVTLELVRHGYAEEDIAKIWSGNTLRLWEQVEAHASRR